LKFYFENTNYFLRSFIQETNNSLKIDVFSLYYEPNT